jgi:hypothetical protein
MTPFKLIKDRLDMVKILALRQTQYVQPLYIEDICEAGQPKQTPLPLSTMGAFQVLSYTGFYTTLQIKTPGSPNALQDLGVCGLRMKIQAGASSLEMFGNYIPMKIILPPGRVRVNPSDTALINDGSTLAVADIGPVPDPNYRSFEYLVPFQANDTISVNVKNDFDATQNGYRNRYGICFMGIRVRDLGAANDEAQRNLAKRPQR